MLDDKSSTHIKRRIGPKIVSRGTPDSTRVQKRVGVTHLDSLQPASKEILKLKQKGSINLVVFKIKQQSFVGYGIDAFQKVKKKMISVGLDVAQWLKQGKTF